MTPDQKEEMRKIFSAKESKITKTDLKYLENRPFNFGEIVKIWKVPWFLMGKLEDYL